MAEYIEREALIKEIGDILNTAPMTYAGGLALALNSARSAPAADVVPVRHGRWIEVEVDKDEDGIPTLIMFGCDKCHAVSWTSTPFCGYCGAKMDGEVDAKEL